MANPRVTGRKRETMTPRSLLTSIGATAIAFALAIVVAAGSATGTPVATDTAGVSSAQTLAAESVSPHSVRRLAMEDSVAVLTALPASHRAERAVNWNADCIIPL